ncbi:MAG: DUF2500 family protein [Planctomycetota bacterium]
MRCAPERAAGREEPLGATGPTRDELPLAAGPSDGEIEERLKELRKNPRYQEAMGGKVHGREVLAHKMNGRRKMAVLIGLGVLGLIAYKQGFRTEDVKGWVDKIGVGPLAAIGAFALFMLSRSSKNDHDLKGPAQSRAAVVVSKRHNDRPNGPGRPPGLDTKFYVTLADAQGVRDELSVKRGLYEALSVNDSGAAYIKGRTLLRFERV